MDLAVVTQRGETQPLRRLMVAVVREAIGCFQRYSLDSTHRGQRLFKDAERWLMVDDTLAPLRFVDICDLLGLDAGYVRRCLREWVARRQTAAARGVRPLRIAACAGSASTLPA